MRAAFNGMDIVGKAERGELSMRQGRPGTPRPEANQPPGTISVTLRYYAGDGSLVATAHAYILPDGTYGGRGRRPDPKFLVVDGVGYHLPDAAREGGVT